MTTPEVTVWPCPYCQGQDRPPASLLVAWCASPEHRAREAGGTCYVVAYGCTLQTFNGMRREEDR